MSYIQGTLHLNLAMNSNYGNGTPCSVDSTQYLRATGTVLSNYSKRWVRVVYRILKYCSLQRIIRYGVSVSIIVFHHQLVKTTIEPGSTPGTGISFFLFCPSFFPPFPPFF